MCRGPEWTFGVWPIVKGRKTKQQCAEACAGTKGCLGFDLSEPKKGTFDCHLYGHHPVNSYSQFNLNLVPKIFTPR